MLDIKVERSTIRLAALHRERTLGRSRQHLDGIEHFGDQLGLPHPVQTGLGQYHRVKLAIKDFAHAGIDVASNRHHLKTESKRAQLSRSTRGPGSHRGAGRQLAQSETISSDQSVTGISSRRYGGKHD